jgi:hypothetical protein
MTITMPLTMSIEAIRGFAITAVVVAELKVILLVVRIRIIRRPHAKVKTYPLEIRHH